MAGRNHLVSNTVAVATAVALLLVLLPPPAAGDDGRRKCNVDMADDVVEDCLRSCWDYREGHPLLTPTKPSEECCKALRNADFRCLCHNFWDLAMYNYGAGCVMSIPSRCKIPKAPDSCYR